MNKYNISVLAEAKEEYTRQLVNIISPHIYVGIKSIYDTAASFCRRTNDKNVLKKFQLLLATIPDWNQSKINDEYKRICKDSECDWIEDLITAVFVSHTKVLSSIKIKKKSKPIELNVPDGPFFIHKCYIEVARNFWKKPYLLHTEFPNLEIQRNLSDSENVIKESVIECIRKLLPVKYILKEYLGNNFEDEDDDITSDVSVNTKSNLRKLVKQEIEQSLSKDANSDNDKLENFSRVEVDDEDTKTDTEVVEEKIDNEVTSTKEQTSTKENPVDETPEETTPADLVEESKSKESLVQEDTAVEDSMETPAPETDKDSGVKLTIEETGEKEVVAETPDRASDPVEENTKLIKLDEPKVVETKVVETRVVETGVAEADEPAEALEERDEKVNNSVEIIDLGSKDNDSLDDIIEKENAELNDIEKVSEEKKDEDREEQKPVSDHESIENINKIRDTIKETISKNNKEDNDAEFSFFEDAAPF